MIWFTDFEKAKAYTVEGIDDSINSRYTKKQYLKYFY